MGWYGSGMLRAYFDPETFTFHGLIQLTYDTTGIEITSHPLGPGALR